MQLLHSRERSLVMRGERSSDVFSLMWNNDESKSPMGRNLLYGTQRRESSLFGAQRVSPAPPIGRGNELSGPLFNKRINLPASNIKNEMSGNIKKSS